MPRSRVFLASLLALIITIPVRAHAINSAVQASQTSLSAEDFKLASYSGKVVLVDFWASWCGSCKKSLPWLNALQKKYGKDGFQVVTINLDHQRENAERALGEAGADLFVVYDEKGTMPEKFGVTAMPSSYLIDKNGKIVSVTHGFSAEEASALIGQIERLLAG